MTRSEELQQICDNWRAAKPERQSLTNAEAIEGMLLTLCKWTPERVSHRTGADGKIIFTIQPPARQPLCPADTKKHRKK